jgi:hypothetical protein
LIVAAGLVRVPAGRRSRLGRSARPGALRSLVSPAPSVDGSLRIVGHVEAISGAPRVRIGALARVQREKQRLGAQQGAARGHLQMEVGAGGPSARPAQHHAPAGRDAFPLRDENARSVAIGIGIAVVPVDDEAVATAAVIRNRGHDPRVDGVDHRAGRQTEVPRRIVVMRSGQERWAEPPPRYGQPVRGRRRRSPCMAIGWWGCDRRQGGRAAVRGAGRQRGGARVEGRGGGFVHRDAGLG